MNAENKGISVIIRTRNEERWIGHCIQSILDNIKNPEIILVDNNSTDETMPIVNSFKSDPHLKNSLGYAEMITTQIDQYTPGKSINLGVKTATNENIIIISSHCVLTQFDLDKHLSDLNNHVAIFGNQTPFYQGKRISKRYIWSHFIDKEVENMYSDSEGRYFFHNALSFFKKDTLLKYPFNEALSGKEDRYWAIDMIEENKLSILYDPAMSVDHHYTDNGNTWKGIG
jgi:rhamnosyltransferase